MQENRNYTKAVLLFLNYPSNRGEENTDFRIFLPYYLGLQHWDATSRHWWSENTIQLKGNFVCEVLPSWCPKARKSPAPSTPSREGCSEREGDKGVSKWDKHTPSSWFTEVPFTGFLVENQVLCTFRHDTSTPKHNQSPLINLGSFPHLVSFSGAAAIQVSVTLSTSRFIHWEASSQTSAFLMLHTHNSCIIHPTSEATSRETSEKCAMAWEHQPQLPGRAQLLGVAKGAVWNLLSAAELLLFALLPPLQRDATAESIRAGVWQEQPWNKRRVIHSLCLRSFSSCCWRCPWLKGWEAHAAQQSLCSSCHPSHPWKNRHFHQVPSDTAGGGALRVEAANQWFWKCQTFQSRRLEIHWLQCGKSC